MNLQMMEGILGASSNIKLSGTPMSVYRQASAEGDTEKMKRAMGYTVDCTEKAAKYQEKLDKGMKAEREKAKLEQETAIEKRREERRRAEEGTEPDCHQKTDQVQISEAAKEALKNKPVEVVEAADSELVIYTETGKSAAALTESEPAFSFTA